MNDNIRRATDLLTDIAESVKHACEDCQEFTCDWCEYRKKMDEIREILGAWQ